jgi:DNA-binding PadR family transcriptional regulator
MTPLSLHILLSLVEDPRHGYGILKAIEARPGAVEPPSTGALYLALQRLEREEAIEPASPPEGADRRRRYWRLTEAGRAAAREEVDRLASLMEDPSVRLLRGGSGGAGG